MSARRKATAWCSKIGDTDAPALQVAQGDRIAPPALAEHLVGRHAHALEAKLAGVDMALAELVLLAQDREAFALRRHEKGADAPPLLAGIGHGEDDHHVGLGALGDELLGAVDDPMVAVEPGRRLEVGRVGAGMRFGQTEPAEHLATGHGLEPALLLLLRAELEKRHADHRVLHGQHAGDAAVDGRNLLDHRAEIGMAGARAAPVLGHHHAEIAEPSHLGHRFARIFGLGFPCRDMRCHPVAGEGPRRFAEHLGLVGVDHQGSSAPSKL
jgi:hypothetical protein